MFPQGDVAGTPFDTSQTPFAQSGEGKKKRQHIKGSLLSGSYKRGGKVKRTGLAKVHKGERVLTAKQARKHKREAKKR
jgi:hypothetical protein